MNLKPITRAVRFAVTVDIETEDGRWRRTGKSEGYVKAAAPDVLGAEFDGLLEPFAKLAAAVAVGANREAWLATQERLYAQIKDHEVIEDAPEAIEEPAPATPADPFGPLPS